MTVPAYPAYRESGVAALGMVPSGWPVTRLRFVADFNPSKQETASLPPDTEVSFLPMEAIGDDGSVRLDATRSLAAVEQGYTYFRDGDVVIAKITPCFENGKGALISGLVGGVGFGTTELIVVRPKERHTLGAFMHWVFVSPDFRNSATASMYGAGGQKRVPDVFVRDFVLALPPPPAQSAIAAFLDRETGKIDGLVAEQERMIGLLKEKRQAVISHAVTKGLDPSAPMKESGVPWLGQVPAHWRVAPLGYVASVFNGSTPDRENPAYWNDGTYPWLTSAHVNRDIIDDSSEFVTEAALENCHLPRIRTKAVLIGITGQGRTRGMASLLVFEATISQHIAAIVPKVDDLLPEFLRLVMDYHYEILRLESDGGGATKGAVTCEQLSRLRVPLPDIKEQEAIRVLLASELGKLDSLTTQSHQAITLLRERRAALISAAVTGKIDVRGLRLSVDEAA